MLPVVGGWGIPSKGGELEVVSDAHGQSTGAVGQRQLVGVVVVCPAKALVTPVRSLVVTVAPREAWDRTLAEITTAATPMAETMAKW